MSKINEAGIELTMDDIMVAKDIIYKSIDRHNEGELSEDELDNVAGGGLI